MKQAIVISGYIVAVVAINLGIDLPLRVAVVALITTIFAITFVKWAHGTPVFGVSIVVFLTMVFPGSVLLFMGSSVYPSWIEAIAAVVRAARQHGVLSGFEWLVPLAAACFGFVVAGGLRSRGVLDDVGKRASE